MFYGLNWAMYFRFFIISIWWILGAPLEDWWNLDTPLMNDKLLAPPPPPQKKASTRSMFSKGSFSLGDSVHCGTTKVKYMRVSHVYYLIIIYLCRWFYRPIERGVRNDCSLYEYIKVGRLKYHSWHNVRSIGACQSEQGGISYCWPCWHPSWPGWTDRWQKMDSNWTLSNFI